MDFLTPFTKIQKLKNIKKVIVSGSKNIAIGENNKIYSWGDKKYIELYNKEINKNLNIELYPINDKYIILEKIN